MTLSRSAARPRVSIKCKSQRLPACYRKPWRNSPCLSHLIGLYFYLSLSLSTFCRSSWSLFSPFSSHVRVMFYSFAVSLYRTLCFFPSRTIPDYPRLIGELLTYCVRNHPTFNQLSRMPTYYLNRFCVSGHGWPGCPCLDLPQGYQQRLSCQWSYLEAHLGQDLLLSSLSSCRQTSWKCASEVRKGQQERSRSFYSLTLGVTSCPFGQLLALEVSHHPVNDQDREDQRPGPWGGITGGHVSQLARQALSVTQFVFPSGNQGFLGAALAKSPPANAGDARDSGSIPGSGRYPGVGNGNPL